MAFLLNAQTSPSVASYQPTNAAAASDDIKKSAAAADEEVREGVRSMVHFKLSPNRHPLNVRKLDPKEKVWENPTHHSVWTKAEVDGVRITHLAANDVRALRTMGV